MRRVPNTTQVFVTQNLGSITSVQSMPEISISAAHATLGAWSLAMPPPLFTICGVSPHVSSPPSNTYVTHASEIADRQQEYRIGVYKTRLLDLLTNPVHCNNRQTFAITHIQRSGANDA